MMILRVFLTMKGKIISFRAGEMVNVARLLDEDATEVIRSAVESVEDPA
jgi:hypothetical protein